MNEYTVRITKEGFEDLKADSSAEILSHKEIGAVGQSLDYVVTFATTGDE